MPKQDARTRDVAGALTPSMRDRFHIPSAPDGSPAIYLAGQSLGLQPRTARGAIETELEALLQLGKTNLVARVLFCEANERL